MSNYHFFFGGKMKRIYKLMFLSALFFSVAFSQSLRIGPSFGLSKANEFTLSNFNYDFDGEFEYGFKAKLDFLTFTLAANLQKATFKNDLFEREFVSVGIGPEFKLIPGPVQPYLSGEVLFTSYNLDVGIPSSFENDAIGLGVGAGIDFQMIPSVDVDLSIKYKFNNLFGKEDGEEAFNTLNIAASFLFSIL